MVYTVGRGVKQSEYAIIKSGNRDYFMDRHVKDLNFETNTRINPSRYAFVFSGGLSFGHSHVSAKCDLAISMQQHFNRSDFNQANVKALKQGLVVSIPLEFMANYINVNEALQGRSVVYDASGNLVAGRKLEGYADKLNHDSWVYLNAQFPKEQEKDAGFLGLDLVAITGLDKEGKLVIKRIPLETCLEEDCWADLESLNSQGFPTKKSPIKIYEPGKSIYFLYPRENFVAGFNAGSDGAGLNCGRYPQYSNSTLGVFPVARSATQKS
ncbi:hypothetical protein J4466_03785 [Candidatus Pacearchaeota archaeon]|nr:hypothetical protein [Candidatus Pacearchaeota archaeon]